MSKIIRLGLVLLLVFVPLFFLRHLGGGFYFSLYDEAKEVFAQSLVLILFCLWLFALARDKKSFSAAARWEDKVSGSLLIFLIFIIISLLWAENRYESLKFIKRWLSHGLLYFLVINNTRGIKDAKVFILAMVGTSVVVALYGIAQYFGWEFPHTYQTLNYNATLGNPSFAGWFLVTTLPLSFILTITSSKKAGRIFFYLASLVLFIHLIITRARASWIGLALGLAVISFFCFKERFFRLRWIITVVSILVLSNLFLTFITPSFVQRLAGRFERIKQGGIRERTVSLCEATPSLLPLPEAMPPLPKAGPLSKEMRLFQPGASWWLERTATMFKLGYGTNWQRLVIWSGTVRMIKDRPFLGVGIGNFNLFYPFYQLNREAAVAYADHFIRQAHNEYLQAAAELGLVGLGLLISFIWILLVCLWRRTLPNTEFRPVGLGLLAGFLATLVAAFFGFNLQSEASSLYFWFAVGLAGARDNLPSLSKNGKILFFPRRWKATKIIVFLLCILILVFIPNIIWRPFLAYWHKQVGYCLSSLRGNNEMAVKELEKSVSIYPKIWETQFILGVCYSELKRYADAEKAYSQALRLNPGYAKTYYNLGNVYYHTERFDKAIDLYSQALKIDSYMVSAYHNIGTIYYQRGDIIQAVNYLYQGAVLEYDKRGSLNLVLSELQNCLNLDPQFEKAKQLLETIEKQKYQF